LAAASEFLNLTNLARMLERVSEKMAAAMGEW